ncbi:hypothetical protein [Devosia sp.]|uniref:hypothetical protein n=1 Tax=Devosia sp. TaxID=1871048 RepID=UPI003BABAC67
MVENPTLDLFTRRFDQLNDMHRELREDIRAISNSMLQLSRQISNLDRRVSDVDRRLTDVKDELEGTIKMELGGAFAHLETKLEHLVERRLAEHQSQFSED